VGPTGHLRIPPALAAGAGNSPSIDALSLLVDQIFKQRIGRPATASVQLHGPGLATGQFRLAETRTPFTNDLAAGQRSAPTKTPTGTWGRLTDFRSAKPELLFLARTGDDTFLSGRCNGHCTAGGWTAAEDLAGGLRDPARQCQRKRALEKSHSSYDLTGT